MKNQQIIKTIFILTLCIATTLSAQTFTDMSHLLSPNAPVGNRSGQRGTSAADFNNDGLVDIYHANFRDPGRLYLNQGEDGFVDVLRDIDLDEGTNMWGAAFGDYNYDGYLDIIFQDLSAPSKLYINNLNGTFTEVTEDAGIAIHTLAQGAAWIDFNLNGRLDFLIVNDIGPNQLFKNLNLADFEDISIAASVETYGNSYGISWGDINLDGYPDAYIATCHISDPLRSINHLLLNNGDETFTNIAQDAGVADSLPGWGPVMFDYDNDGDIDVFVGNSYHPPREAYNRLYRNDGNNQFTAAQHIAGVAGDGNENNYGVSVADFDNDGWEDIYLTALFRRDRLYRNNGDGTFTNIAAQAGVRSNDHRAVAVADFNNDGWIDIFTVGRQPHNLLLYNEGGTNHWLKIRLRGLADNYFGVGTRIELYTDSLRQIREVRAGDSFCSQNLDITAHFGLGEATVIDSLILRWPTGTVDKLYDITAIDQEMTIVQGGTINNRPQTFHLQTPADGDTLLNLSGDYQFSWDAAVDPEENPLSYEFRLTGTNRTTAEVVDTTISGLSETSVTINRNMLRDNYRYRWTVDARDSINITASTNAWEFLVIETTGIGDEASNLPQSYALDQNFPNPFNPTTNIGFRIAELGFVELKIYDASGRLVKTLMSENRAAGDYNVSWDATDESGQRVASGIYLYKLQAGDFLETKKMVLMK